MKKLPLLLFMALFAFASCSDREEGNGLVLGEGEAWVNMSFFNSSTRVPTDEEIAAGIDKEKQINTLDLLVFKGDEYQYMRHASKGSASTNFRATLKVDDGLDVYFLANSRELLDKLVSDGDLVDDSKESWVTVKALLLDADPARFADNEAGNIDNSANRSNLPMWGEIKNVAVTKDEIAHWSGLNLLRAVAGVDIYTVAGIADFEFVNAYLYFVPDKGSLVPLGTYDLTVDGDVESKSADGMKTSLTFGPVSAENNTTVAHQFYLYDNDTDKASYNETDRRYTRIVIGGRYKGIMYYYPADFLLKGKDQNNQDIVSYDKITRNEKYVFIISKVNGKGYPDPGTASEQPPVNINTDLLPWDGNGNMGFDGTYYVSIGKKEANVGPKAGSQDYINITTNAHPDAIFFDFEEKLDPITGDPINGPQTEILDSNGKVIGIENDRFKVEKVISADGQTVEEIRFTAKGDYDNTNPARNEETVKIQVGNLEFEIPLKQTQGGNPWNPGGDIDTPVGRE